MGRVSLGDGGALFFFVLVQRRHIRRPSGEICEIGSLVGNRILTGEVYLGGVGVVARL